MKEKRLSNEHNCLNSNVALILLRDFFYRYWWVVICVMLIAFISNMFSILEATGSHFFVKMFLFPVGPYLLFWEQRQGVRKVIRTLPIPRDLLTHLLWQEGVIIFPILFLSWCFILALPVTLLMSSSILSLQNMLTNAVLLSAMAMGFTGTLIYAQYYDFSDIFQNKKNLLWTLLGSAVIVALLLYPVYETNDFWHLPLLTCCLIIIAISYISHNHLLSETVVPRQNRKESPPSYFRSNFSFWRHFWAAQLLPVLFVFLLFAGIAIVWASFKKIDDRFDNYFVRYSISMSVLIPATLAAWSNEVRQLRILPMTSGRLSLLLLSIPLVSIIGVTFFFMILFTLMGIHDRLWYLLIAACYSFGFSVILCNVTARFGRLAFGIGIGIASQSFLILYPGQQLLYIVPFIGLALLPALTYQIKYSSKVYRPHPRSGNGLWGR